MAVPVSRTDIIIELGARELDAREQEKQASIDKAAKDLDQVTARAIEMDQANRDLRQELADAKRDADTMAEERDALQASLDDTKADLDELTDKLATLEKNLESVLKSQERATRETTKEIKDLKADLRSEKKEARQLATELRQAKREKPKRYVIDKNMDGRVVATLLYEGEDIPEKEDSYGIT